MIGTGRPLVTVLMKEMINGFRSIAAQFLVLVSISSRRFANSGLEPAFVVAS